MIADIDVKLGEKRENVDAVLIVFKMTDYRASIQEIMAIQLIQEFLENFQAKRLFLVITHCDLMEITEEHISGKINSFQNYGRI